MRTKTSIDIYTTRMVAMWRLLDFDWKSAVCRLQQSRKSCFSLDAIISSWCAWRRVVLDVWMWASTVWDLRSELRWTVQFVGRIEFGKLSYCNVLYCCVCLCLIFVFILFLRKLYKNRFSWLNRPPDTYTASQWCCVRSRVFWQVTFLRLMSSNSTLEELSVKRKTALDYD